ncbi:hypothetical protein ACQ4PT_057700 [Festuca glaucescens]
MDADKDKGNDKVHLRDWSSQEALRTYKRRRQPEPEPVLEPKPVVVPEQQVTDTFWKSRDIGWKHGIMIDENRQHWKCMYCHLTRNGGGVSRLKRHLAGDLDVKMCPKVPADVAEKIREHLQKKRERRKKRAAQNGGDSVTRSFADDTKAEKDPLPIDLEVPTRVDACVLEEVTNKTNEGHQEPTIPWPPFLLRGVRDIGWEHAVDLDGNKKRWQCKWCDLCRSGGVTTLKAHLTDSSCPKIPMEMSKQVLNFIEEKRAARQLFNKDPWPAYNKVGGFCPETEKEGTVPCKDDQQPSNNAMHMLTSEKCAADELATGSNQCGTEHSGQPVENYEQSKKGSDQPEEQLPMEHDRHHVLNNEHQDVDKNTDNSQNKEVLKHPLNTRFSIRKHIVIIDEISKHWRCRYCGVQEGAGIQSCIRDVLLYGCAEFGSVRGKVEMDSDRTVSSNVCTTECKNVLVDVLRSENFALLCNVLCKTVHQDEERSRYFDFGVIDSRMKNGEYGCAPEMFKDDLKLGAVAASSEPKKLIESGTSFPSTSQGLQQLDQPDPINVYDVQKGSACDKCGKETRGVSTLTCNGCLLVCHISCSDPLVPSMSSGSWYCKSCSSATRNESAEGSMGLAHYEPNLLHGNCVLCKRLEVRRSQECKATVHGQTPVGESRAAVPFPSTRSTEGQELSTITDPAGSCKICGTPEEDGQRFLICGHGHCPYKYYHVSCLKSKQIASDVQRDKLCWYCPSCLCRVCLRDGDDDLTILCDGCDEAYHLYCITPRRTSVPKGKWYCSSCSVERAKAGMRRYEKKVLKNHRKDDALVQSRNFAAVDLLLSAAEKLREDEQQVTRAG